MEQLTGFESFILRSEQGNLFNHVAALGLYDPSTAAGGRVRFKDVLRHFERRLHVHPLFTRRLAEVPYGLDRPYWMEGAEVDIEFHVRHLALPQPGDWRQLMIQVARLHSRPLDRSRPLWEIYVIERLDRIPGLPRGAFAMFMKFHHASVDGMAAMQVVSALHDATPDARPPRRKRPAASAAPNPPALDSSILMHGVGRAIQLSRFSAASARKASGLAVDRVVRRLAGGDEDGAPPLPSFPRAPATRFNAPISANRVVEAIGLPLAALKPVRAAVDGATINDVFLAVSGGAVRRYLAAKSELPGRSLVALMPISVRSAERSGSNEVGGVAVPVRSDIANPLARLRAVHNAANDAKRQADLVGRDLAMRAIDALPHTVAGWLMRGVMMPQLNLTVSNVRGPDAPLYAAGARLERLYPVSMPTDQVGLNLTGASFDGVLWISAVACRNMMPDPAFFAECLRASFAELEAAAASTRAGRDTPMTREPPARRRPAPPKPPRKSSRG